jgi:integrase
MPIQQKAATVKLFWLTKTDKGWRRFPCLYEQYLPGVKRPRAGWVLENGQKVHYPDGRFQTREYENGKTVWRNVLDAYGGYTTEPVLAVDARRKREIATTRARHQMTQIKTGDPLAVLDRAADAYIEFLENDKKASEAMVIARLVLREFLPVCRRAGVTRTQDVNAGHLNTYMSECAARENSHRTQANKHDRVMFFLKWTERVNLAAIRKLAPRPEYDKNKEVKTYTRAQIESLFSAADEYMTVVLRLGLGLGLREQEIMYAEWSDVNWTAKTYRVQSKPERSFRIKTKTERDMPIPADLLTLLKEWRERRPDTSLIVGTASDSPNTHLLRQLKRMAKNAGLNCGTCAGCKGELQECRQFGLHTLRRTYATALLRGGADIATVQTWAGHRDIATTRKYLKALDAQSHAAHKQVNAMDFGD